MPDEQRGYLGDDGVAVGAQLAHSAGYPMSQREKFGFSRYPAPLVLREVSAEVPAGGGSVPITSGAVSDSPIIPGRGETFPPLIASVVVGVGQPARIA